MDRSTKQRWRARLDEIPHRAERTARIGLASFVCLAMLMDAAGHPSEAIEAQRENAARSWGHQLTRSWLNPWLTEYRGMANTERQQFITWLLEGAEVRS
ncbi:MAG TPA: hypothetical protein VHQ86_05790 [Candidatus Saccharimonadia bacterium]|jgi:hypothetical protein|nr:hypothetical protein [Candidatus Saccharimonadia bacterium]